MIVNNEATNFHFSDNERVQILTEIRYVLMLIMENNEQDVLSKFPKLLEMKSFLDKNH